MTMTANDIRKKFLDFFASQGHTIVASDSVVPKDDPTVLFTTAGMQQFKRQFLGHIDDFTRAATSQKCLRTDDLDKVGQTAFHHTFFEMLGNFSFGEYFKKEAIAWAWEFLTQVVKIPAEKLWVSVYREDSEAARIWLEDIHIPKDRLVRLGDKSNFWPSEAKEKGPNGPCGPCSEIFYDYGVNPNCTSATCDPDCNCGRFSEIWNLVFTQFNRKEGGVLEPLPNKNIDTGMGLERLVAVVQGKKINYDTDLFMPIRQAIREEVCHGKVKLELQEELIIADHIRAIVFAITDGVIPSNKERGSVVKRLINDSTNIILNRGGTEASIYKLVPSLVEVMKGQYPELLSKAGSVAELIKKTEEAFIQVRQERLPELKAKLPQTKTPEERGELYFKFHDTYGLPLGTIFSTAQEVLGVTVSVNTEDGVCYSNLMKEQQDRARAASKMAGDVFVDTIAPLHVPKTKFIGYEQMAGEGNILKLFISDQDVNEASEGDAVKVILDRTPFYAEAGGQVGDSGYFNGPQGRIRITDTQKVSDISIHSGRVETGKFTVHETVSMIVDEERRLSVMRNHTATHLLQAALRKVLGTHVQQQGSLVAEDRLRFDFTHPAAITPQQKAAIEDFVNSHVLACDGVDKKAMSLEEAKKSGALAFFAEKYGSTVRVVSIGGYSKEFCGGTHLNSTGQIGLFKITSESAIAQGIRRIEAKTGLGAITLVHEQEQQLNQIAQTLKAPVAEVVDRLNTQAARLKQMEKDLGQYRLEAVKGELPHIVDKGEILYETKVISYHFQNVEIEMLRKIHDLIKQIIRYRSYIIILGGSHSGGADILWAISDDLTAKGLKADEFIRKIAPVIHGSGGGRPKLAQAGSKDASRLQQALDLARELVIKEINGMNK